MVLATPLKTFLVSQIPVFISSMLALREMAAEGHPGFDTVSPFPID